MYRFQMRTYENFKSLSIKFFSTFLPYILLFAIFFLTSKIHYKNVESEIVAYNETAQLNLNDLEEVEDNEVPEELIKRVEEFKEKLNPNLVETEVVNLGNAEVIQETRVSIHMTKEDKKEYTEFLIENKDIFAWSYADMTGLSTAIVAHRLPTDPACPPVK